MDRPAFLLEQGLGARDSLRLEAVLCLYGNDMEQHITPVEARLTWAIGKRRRAEGGFLGAEVILKQIEEGPSIRRVGFISSGSPARSHSEIQEEKGQNIGEITSGGFSPCLKKNIAMGYVKSRLHKPAKKRDFFIRGFHLGNHFTRPVVEDIVFKAICVNLRRKKLNFMDQLSSTLTNSLIYRVFREFRRSPNLVLEFHERIKARKCVLDSLDSCCILIHAMVDLRNFDDALCLMKKMMVSKGYLPLEISEALINSCDKGFSSSAVFDALIRICTELGATEEVYVVIEKLRTRGYWISIHAWNNFLNHLLKIDEVGRFWIVYNEMISYGYYENLNTLNIIIYAHCIEGELSKALTVLYRMLKCGILPNVISFNMLIDGACRALNLTLAHQLVKKMGDVSRGCVYPNVVSYNCLINGYCKLGKMDCAKEIIVEMIKMEESPNVRTYATLVDGYARHGYLEEAFRLCDIMVEKGMMLDSVIYNSLIHWIYVSGYTSVASLLLSNMMENYIFPDHFTHSIISKELCRNGHVTEALEFHGWALDKNLVKDNFPYNILIDYLFRSNNISGAKQLLCSMFVRGFIPDLLTYATMIDGYCKAG